MCNFNFEAQMQVFDWIAEHNSHEDSLKRLQSIGVLDEKGEFTPDYSFLKKEVQHAPAI